MGLMQLSIVRMVVAVGVAALLVACAPPPRSQADIIRERVQASQKMAAEAPEAPQATAALDPEADDEDLDEAETPSPHQPVEGLQIPFGSYRKTSGGSSSGSASSGRASMGRSSSPSPPMRTRFMPREPAELPEPPAIAPSVDDSDGE